VPVGRELGRAGEVGGEVVVAVVGVGHVRHGQAMGGLVADADGVARAYLAGNQDAQVGSRPAGRGEAAREARIAEADAELVAGVARIRIA
jgi:hypothetical protein